MINLKNKIAFVLAFSFSVYEFNAQTIKVYFNQSVDNTVSALADAHSSSALDDTIVSFINGANSNLDLAVWDNGSTSIVTAINNAYNRGVQVRYISSTNSLNSALSGLNSNIPVLKRSSTLTSNVMHNKFVVVDNARLLTGSMNFGNGSIHDDYNNILIINDAALASNYVAEFNEMWGSAGPQPDLNNSKFGPDKTDNTFHSFTVGTIPVQSYFSPTDNTTAQIVNAINTADHTLDISIFTFTNNDLGDAVVLAKNRGVVVRCIMENQSYIGSEYNNLLSNGISVVSHQSIPNDFHHKYCIIDAMYPASNPTVVTGSHNWTNSAEQEYDENTLIINDEFIANEYTEEFVKRFEELTVGLNETGIIENGCLFPNPAHNEFYIKSKYAVEELVITDPLGRVVFSDTSVSNHFYPNLWSGVYVVTFKLNGNKKVEKLIIE